MRTSDIKGRGWQDHERPSDGCRRVSMASVSEPVAEKRGWLAALFRAIGRP